MKKILLSAIMIALFLSATSIESLQGQTVGNPAPDFSLQTLDGKTFTLSEQTGKVVFIFLFGNTCTHCLANGPNTQTLYKDFMSNPDFVAIGIDVWDGNASSVTSFKNRTGITYPMALNGSALTSVYSTTYDRILVVDQEGILQFKGTSNASSDVTNMVAEQLEELLKSGATGIDNIDAPRNELYVYPNPVRDYATVQSDFDPGTEVQLSLIGINGQLAVDEIVQTDQSGQIKVDLNSYTAGLYYLRIRSGDVVKGTRIVINGR